MYFKNLKKKHLFGALQITSTHTHAPSFSLLFLSFSRKFTRQEHAPYDTHANSVLKTTSGICRYVLVTNVPLVYTHLHTRLTFSRVLAFSTPFLSFSLPPVLLPDLSTYLFLCCTFFRQYTNAFMVLRYIHLSWRARGERERDAGPIKKIITRFRGTSSSPNFDVAALQKANGWWCRVVSFFSFFFGQREEYKRHYSNIVDIQKSFRSFRRLKNVHLFLWSSKLFYATRSLLEAVDWVISAPLSITICHDVYKSGLILNGINLLVALVIAQPRSHSRNPRRSAVTSLFSHALTRSLSPSTPLPYHLQHPLPYQRLSLAIKPYSANCYSFLPFNEALEKL